MSTITKRTGLPVLALTSCFAALTLFNGCGGGGGGADLDVGINGSTFASAVTLPNAGNTSNSVCSGRSGDLQLTQVSITVNSSTSQIAVALAAPNIQGFTFSQGGYDTSTRRVNFRGEATDTSGNRLPVLFDGILNNTREPNSLSGILDFTCFRGFINLVSQSNTGFPAPAPTSPFPSPTVGFFTPTPNPTSTPTPTSPIVTPVPAP